MKKFQSALLSLAIIFFLASGFLSVPDVQAQIAACDAQVVAGEALRFRAGPEIAGQSLDPDQDQIYYVFDWGDRQTARIPASGFVDSTETQEAVHDWAANGSYAVTVRAFDPQDAASEFSNTLRICVGPPNNSPVLGDKAFARADFNADNITDIADLAYLLTHWGTNDAKADLNKDGKVDILDYTIWLAYWFAKGP